MKHLLCVLLAAIVFCACSNNVELETSSIESVGRPNCAKSEVLESSEAQESSAKSEVVDRPVVPRNAPEEAVRLLVEKNETPNYYEVAPIRDFGYAELLIFDQDGKFINNVILSKDFCFNTYPISSSDRELSIFQDYAITIKYIVPGLEGIFYPQLIDLRSGDVKVAEVNISPEFGVRMLENGLIAMELYPTELYDDNDAHIGRTMKKIVLLTSQMEMADTQLQFDYQFDGMHWGKLINGIVYNPVREEYITTYGLTNPYCDINEEYPLHIAIFNKDGILTEDRKFSEYRNAIQRLTKSDFVNQLYLFSDHEILICGNGTIYVNLDDWTSKQLPYDYISFINRNKRTFGIGSTIYQISKNGEITELANIETQSLFPQKTIINYDITKSSDENCIYHVEEYALDDMISELVIKRSTLDIPDSETVFRLRECSEEGCNLAFDYLTDVIYTSDRFYVLHK